MTENLTVLAFDFGIRRIGVAVGSGLTAGAQPLQTIVADDDDRRFDAIGRLIREWQPQRLVVGRPNHPDGRPMPISARCDRFARQLRGRFDLPVDLVDESYSSVEADRPDDEGSPDDRRRRTRAPRIGGRHHDDAGAAAVILRQYWSEHPPS